MVQLVYRSGFRESTCHLTVVALWDVNGNRNGLWHCHSAIVQKLVAPLLHNSCTLLFDCIIPVGGPCNVHITCIRILLIPIDCRQASGRPRFTSFLTCINTIVFALYELALQPDIQNTLRKEIHQALNNFDGKITYDMVRQYHLSYQIISVKKC